MPSRSELYKPVSFNESGETILPLDYAQSKSPFSSIALQYTCKVF